MKRRLGFLIWGTLASKNINFVLFGFDNPLKTGVLYMPQTYYNSDIFRGLWIFLDYILFS